MIVSPKIPYLSILTIHPSIPELNTSFRRGHPSTQAQPDPFILLSNTNHTQIHPSIHPFYRLPIHQSIHPIHPSIHPSILPPLLTLNSPSHENELRYCYCHCAGLSIDWSVCVKGEICMASMMEVMEVMEVSVSVRYKERNRNRRWERVGVFEVGLLCGFV